MSDFVVDQITKHTWRTAKKLTIICDFLISCSHALYISFNGRILLNFHHPRTSSARLETSTMFYQLIICPAIVQRMINYCSRPQERDVWANSDVQIFWMSSWVISRRKIYMRTTLTCIMLTNKPEQDRNIFVGVTIWFCVDVFYCCDIQAGEHCWNYLDKTINEYLTRYHHSK